MVKGVVVPLSGAGVMRTAIQIALLEQENQELWARIEALEHENVLLSLQGDRSIIYYKLWRRMRK
jgi:hypothetical protein